MPTTPLEALRGSRCESDLGYATPSARSTRGSSAAFHDVQRLTSAPTSAEYGHRETVTPVLVTPPTQRDAPDTVLALIKVLAARPPRPPEDQRPRSATGCSSTRCCAVAGATRSRYALG